MDQSSSDDVQLALRQLIDTTCEALQHGVSAPSSVEMQKGPAPERSMVAPESPFPLNAAEYEELLTALEARLYDDMLQEEADYLQQLEQQDIDGMVEEYQLLTCNGKPVDMCMIVVNAGYERFSTICVHQCRHECCRATEGFVSGMHPGVPYAA
jgi:hypothetical protein